ncbi:MAG: TraB/GumN family protein [Saprospiraceae bacterium]
MSKEKGVLFKINKKDSNTSHYLMGTMHVDNEASYTYIGLAQKFIQKCYFYYAEMDLTSVNHQEMMEHFKFKDEEKLHHHFKPSHFLKMRKQILKSTGFDLQVLDDYIPFYIQTMLSEQALQSRNGLPLDYFLWNYAMTQNKILGGVETMEDQIHILNNIPLDAQIKSLRTTCRNMNKFRKKILWLNNAYQVGDIRGIYKMSKKNLGSLRKIMLTERNNRMLESMLQKMKEDSAFFAVGAAHLAGKYGLLRSLKKEGYKIFPCKE